MKYRYFALLFVIAGFAAGCGPSENTITSPEKFLPPTGGESNAGGKSATTTTTGNSESQGTAKFVP
jgi:hypothetical protein